MMRSWLMLLCAALASGVPAPAPAAAQARTPSLIERTGTFAPEPINESSGVAVSRSHEGVLWTHNDAGHGPYLYAVDPAGTLLATFEVAGARSVDWEDIALGPCPRAPHRDCLYIGDIGDNLERRDHVVIYVVREPNPAAGSPDTVSPTGRAGALRVRYADGAHDAEALVVTPDGTAVIVTKGRNGHVLRYVIPREAFFGGSVTVAAKDTLAIRPAVIVGRLVTGAAISPSGRRVVVRTYTELYFYRRDPGEVWRREGRPCWVGLMEPQGEAVDFLDEQTVVLTSEAALGLPGPIHRVRCN
jgi:hypothetical protein